MNTYFLDTNALVKRYHQEIGSDVIDQLFAESGVRFFISDISIIEFFSAISLKVRTRELDEMRFSLLKKLFAQDVKTGVYDIVKLSEKEKVVATKLLLKYAKQYSLRTLDAMQLALMKSVERDAINAVVCADEKFGKVITREGFRLINPVKGP